MDNEPIIGAYSPVRDADKTIAAKELLGGIKLPPKNAADFYRRFVDSRRLVVRTSEGTITQNKRLHSRELVEDNKLTGTGKEYAKAVYAAINFGSWQDVSSRLEELKLQVDQYKKEGRDDEAKLLRKVIQSAEMQVRNNVMQGIKEEILASQDEDTGWARGLSMTVGVAEGRVKLGEKGDKKIESAAVAQIYGLRNKLLRHIEEKTAKSPEHRLAGTSFDERMGLVRLLERELIDEFVKNQVAGETGVDVVRKVYKVAAESGEPDLEALEAKMIGMKTRTEQLEKDLAAQAKPIERPVRKRKFFRKAQGVISAATATLAGVGSALGLFSPFIKAPTEMDVYQEFARQRGNAIVEQVDSSQFDYPGLTIENVPIGTQMITVPEEAMNECLTPVNTNQGSTVWVYNEEATDSDLCQKYFGGAKFAETDEYKNAGQIQRLDVPAEYSSFVKINDFVRFDEQGATCSLTSIASIVSTLRLREGLPALHPAVFSDLSRNVEKGVTGIEGRKLDEYSNLNIFYYDAVGLKNLGVSVNESNLAKVVGEDLVKRIVSEDLQNLKEGKKSFSISDKDYQYTAEKVFNHLMTQIDKGFIPNMAFQVNEKYGHVVTVLGGVLNQETGNYELYVNEPNGGYTGWKFTKDNWQSVGNNGLVKIVLNRKNVALMAPYLGLQVSFAKFDPALLPPDKIELRFAEIPLSSTSILTPKTISSPSTTQIEIDWNLFQKQPAQVALAGR